MIKYYLNSITKKDDIRFYHGQSMTRTFKTGDCLKLQKILAKQLCIGDVIIFTHIQADAQTMEFVHRISNIFTKGWITRGDNNPGNDDEPVAEKNIVGKVTHYERNGKIHKVWNGRMGLMRARVLHGRLHVISATKFFLRKPYRLLKRSGIVAKLWRPEISTIHFETQDGPLVKYVHKSKTVASCWLNSNNWWFRRPYDFVVGPKLKK